MAHPVYGWTLTPNSKISVPFRNEVIQNINQFGQRQVAHPPENVGKSMSVYGCSFTYGTGLADNETFTSILQSSLPGMEIENKGIGGHNTVQNFLRFRDDIKNDRVDFAIFGVISDHRYRNIPHPYRMKAHLTPDWYQIGVEHVPHVHLDRQGEAYIDFTSIWQPSVFRNDFDAFLPDEYYLDLATISILREIVLLGRNNGIPVILALLDQLDTEFNRMVITEFEEAIDVSTPYNPEYSFQPDDLHPNQLSNELFAQRLLVQIHSMVTH